MENIKFTIITASYNYEKYIKETIESVLAQSYQNWEMIIVDDGSKDNSIEVIKSYCEKDPRIKLYTHKNHHNKGLIETVKLGIKKAKTDWLVFLESDDTIVPNYLERKLEIIKNDKNVKFIYNDVNLFGNQERISSFDEHFECAKRLIRENPYPNSQLTCFDRTNIVPTFSVVCCKKELFNNIDFNCPIKAIVDLYLWAQIARKTSLFYIDEKLTNWRIHQSYMTKYKKTNFEDVLFRYKMKLATSNKNITLLVPLFIIRYFFTYVRKSIIKVHPKQREIILFGKTINY